MDECVGINDAKCSAIIKEISNIFDNEQVTEKEAMVILETCNTMRISKQLKRAWKEEGILK